MAETYYVVLPAKQALCGRWFADRNAAIEAARRCTQADLEPRMVVELVAEVAVESKPAVVVIHGRAE